MPHGNLMGFIYYKKYCVYEDISCVLLFAQDVNAFPEETGRDVALHFLYVNGHFNKDSDQNNIEY